MPEPLEAGLNTMKTESMWSLEGSMWSLEGLHPYMGWVGIGSIQNKTEQEIKKIIYDFQNSNKSANNIHEFHKSIVDVSIFSGFRYRKEL
jgi:hypothetical protein